MESGNAANGGVQTSMEQQRQGDVPKTMSSQCLLEQYAELQRNTISFVHRTNRSTSSFDSFPDTNYNVSYNPNRNSIPSRMSSTVPLSLPLTATSNVYLPGCLTADASTPSSVTSLSPLYDPSAIYFTAMQTPTVTAETSFVRPVIPASVTTTAAASATLCSSPIDEIISGNDADDDRASFPLPVRLSNGCGAVKASTTAATGVSLPADDSDTTMVRHAVIRQLVLSVVRNVGCYALLAALLTIAGEGHMFAEHFMADLNRVFVLVVICIGLMAAVLQVIHVCDELSGKTYRRSLLFNMISQPINRTEFEHLMADRHCEAPYIGLQLRWRHNLRNLCCRRSGAMTSRIVKILEYSTWSDHSQPTSSILWTPSSTATTTSGDNVDDSSKPSWIVVTKDFRVADERTRRAVQADVDEFKIKSGFQSSRMRFSFLLDVQRGEDFPDTEAFLVFADSQLVKKRSLMYSLSCYRVVLCLCVDSLYAIVFYCCTHYAGSYTIVKHFAK